MHYVPGEHDNAADDGKEYLARFGKGTKGTGWYSFDHKGVHFVGLVNSAALEGMGKLGAEQLAWLKDDLSGRTDSTPLVLFAHIPLWTVYPDWGWGTADSEQALSYVRRFGSVTVLNGHIHQTMQKVEGNVSFHTAMSTAFPQPAPGSAPSAGSMKVPAEKLRGVLGISRSGIPRGPRGTGGGECHAGVAPCWRRLAGAAVLCALSTPEERGKDLFERRCSGCHALRYQ